MDALWLALAAAVLTGYAAGRARPWPRLIDWAQDQVTQRPARSPRFWLAAPVLLAGLAVLWTCHPRRSAANVRSWHQDRTPPSTPRRDPDWAARRGARTEGDPQ
ncbi:hypothetical protein [Streptomyces chryseus]|uniref:Uncharacterized protein n=1 Tax=Streptomyces chryseus TaxID=68186 RepID=A0ABQ3DIH3_9ACTN|nr:hypothetical protein [Streptomyces chryseus]GHA94186.1 hypothetical protein GCM10010346_16160 [Streptomyces chryseus]